MLRNISTHEIHKWYTIPITCACNQPSFGCGPSEFPCQKLRPCILLNAVLIVSWSIKITPGFPSNLVWSAELSASFQTLLVCQTLQHLCCQTSAEQVNNHSCSAWQYICIYDTTEHLFGTYAAHTMNKHKQTMAHGCGAHQHPSQAFIVSRLW